MSKPNSIPTSDRHSISSEFNIHPILLLLNTDTKYSVRPPDSRISLKKSACSFSVIVEYNKNVSRLIVSDETELRLSKSVHQYDSEYVPSRLLPVGVFRGSPTFQMREGVYPKALLIS